MMDARLARMVRGHFERLFPRSCPRCGRSYASLRDFIEGTTRVGHPRSYDAEVGDWMPTEPLGTMTVSNCSCGTTLALSTQGMPLPELHAGMHWLKTESQRRQKPPEEVLACLRDNIRQQVLTEGNGQS